MSENLENRITSTQAKDAIYKAHLMSSAEKVNNLILNKQVIKPNNLIQAGEDLVKFDSLGGWVISTGDESKFTVVNAPFFGGSSYIQYLETEIGTNASISKEVHFSLMGIDTISIYLWVDNFANYSNITLELTSGNINSWTNRLSKSLKELISTPADGWNNIRLKLSDFAKIGTITNFDTIKALRIIGTGKAGTYNYMRFGGLKKNEIPRFAIAITMDDGYDTDYFVSYQKLKQYGFKGTSYLISDAIGTIPDAPRLTLAQIREMLDYGWTFGIHGKTSLNWVSESNITETEVSISGCIKYFIENDIYNEGIHHCAYPHGEFNNDVINVLKKYNIKSGRTTDIKIQNSPPENLMKIKLGLSIDVDLQTNIDNLEALVAQGGLINVYHHEITTREGTTKPSPEVYNAFIDYIAINYGRYVVSLPQWVKDNETGTII